MKRVLLAFTIVFGAIFSANAQTTIVSTTFGTTTPAGWTQQTTSVNNGWLFGTSFAPIMQYYAPAQGDDAYVDDWDYNTSSLAGWDTLYTATINCSTYSHVFLTMNYMFYFHDGAETATVIVSNDGGHTWHLAGNLANTNGGWTNGSFFDLTPYAGGKSNVKIGFTYYNGYASVTNGNTAVGMAIENLVVSYPLNYDLSVVSQNLPLFVQNNTPVNISGGIYNYGGDSIVSMHMNYSVDGGHAVADALTSLSFQSITTYNFTIATTWVPTDGYHTIKIWADNLNGANVDQNHANDTLTTAVLVVDSSKAKEVLYEEFMQASCGPCMNVTPTMDAVLRMVIHEGICNPIRYHVNWPGVDYMNDEVQPFVGARVGYYGIGAVPDAKIDGSTDSYPGNLTVQQIQTDAKMASPIKIDITSAVYNYVTNVYSATVNITAFTPYSAGLIAQAVLTVDTIVYAADQSTADQKRLFAPPIGSGTYADSMYQYVMQFPDVAEDMMPSSSGSTLTSFTSGQTQTLNLTWTKNRPWGLNPDTNQYDSLFPGSHITVFVQTATAVPQIGLAARYVYQSATCPFTVTPTGIEKLTKGVYFNMYPNPTNGNTTIEFSIEKRQTVMIDVYNMLGERVYSTDQDTMETGKHTILINGQGLKSGVYFVRFTTDNAATTRKLVIQH